jgi:antimicrobial peptide system SdpB family protein
LVAYSAWYVIRLQVAFVYFQASVGKMPVREWADGTAVYYWFLDPWFGMPGWLAPLVMPFLRNGVVLTSVTWGVIGLEFLLCTALVMAPRFWGALLRMGVALHLGIALIHGLVSFALVMFAALLLFLRPIHEPLMGLGALSRLVSRLTSWRGEGAVTREASVTDT